MIPTRLHPDDKVTNSPVPPSFHVRTLMDTVDKLLEINQKLIDGSKISINGAFKNQKETQQNG